MPKLAEVGDCPLCFGRLLPLSVCQSCNTVAAQDVVDVIGPQLTCEDCGATNPTHFVCSACNARFPYAEIVKPEGPTCPVCKHPVPPRAALCPNCSAVLPASRTAGERPARRIRGEFGEEDLRELARIPNLSGGRAEALAGAGYNAPWKIARATEAELGRVKGVGPRAAAQIKEAIRFLVMVGPKKSKEDVLSEESACPLCGTATSLFATRCHDCGAVFDEEELDEEFRREVEREEEKGLLAYYDVRLLESPEDAALHYARGVLLLSMGRAADALASLDRALELRPGHARALQAKARALSGAKGTGSAAQVLRDVVDAAGPRRPAEAPAAPEEAEAIEALGTLEEAPVECPECGEKQLAGAAVCPVCGHRFAPEAAPAAEEVAESLEEERLLDELERAVAGEAKAPPPPLKPEVPAAVVDRKREMLAFLLRIPGVSRRAAEAVSGFFQDLNQVNLSEAEDLGEIPGVAPAEARLILETVRAKLGPVEEEAPPAVPPPTAPEPAPERPTARPPIVPAPPVRPAPRVARADAGLRRPLELAGRRGLINGRGLVNGRGRVNGLINGSGFVNGSSLAEVRLPRKRLLPRYLAIGAAMLMLFGAAVSLNQGSPPSTRIVVDGSLGDWAGIAHYNDSTISGVPAVQITSASVNVSDSHLFIRVGVAGTIFSNANAYHTIYAFLDTDPGQPGGYDLTDMRPDYFVQISGAGGRVEDARLMRFSGPDPRNWSNWTVVQLLDAAAGSEPGGSAVEVDVPTDSLAGFDARDFLVRAVAEDDSGATSHTVVPIHPAKPGLLVIQRAATGSGVVTGTQDFLEVELHAIGGQASVSSIQTSSENGTIGLPNPAGPWVIGTGTPRIVTFQVNPGGAPLGAAVSAQVLSVTTADSNPVAVVGPPVRGYASQIVLAKRIDGLFQDWAGPGLGDSDAGPIRRPSLDIATWDGAIVGSDEYLFARLNGPPLEGGWIPARVLRPSPGGAGNASAAPGVRPPPAIGYDYVRFYLRTNASAPDGYDANGLLANRLVEVRGRGGVITDAAVYDWTGQVWRRAGSAYAALGGQEVEVRGTVSGIALNETQIVATTADWAGVADVTAPSATRGGTRGDPGLVPLSGTNAQLALAKPLTNIPTVDGSCASGGASEYAGAGNYNNANMTFHVGRRSSVARVYFCVEVTLDGDNDSGADWGELLLDQNHTADSAPQASDRRFRQVSGGSFTQEKGDGSVWVGCGSSCDSGNAAAAAFNNSVETYEFNISFLDVWGTGTPDANDRAGFAIVAFDSTGSNTYAWGAGNVDENAPSTWGHLDIPEFPEALAVGVATVLVLALVRRRRRAA